MKSIHFARRLFFAPLVTAIAALLVFPAFARADVKLPAIISDNMCLQQDQPVPIWGWASPGEKVTVTFVGQTQSTEADKDGDWMVKLGPLKASETPAEMTVAGKNQITIKNVLVGQVWVCSGQSNMQFRLSQAHNARGAIAAAADPKLRLFTVRDVTAVEPQKDTPTEGGLGRWVECTPASASYFSAVGYFFGRDLRKGANVPVGLIHSSWGGTPAESWTSIEGLKSRPELKFEVARVENLQPRVKEYDAVMAEWKAADDVWRKSSWADYQKAMAQWQQDAKAAQEAHKALPPKPLLAASEPRRPHNPVTDPNMPTLLYNAMIRPLMPYAIRGVIWYQGENNAGRPDEYRTLFPTMIEDWRNHWAQATAGTPPTQATTPAATQATAEALTGAATQPVEADSSKGNFAFLFVQLANFMARETEPTDTGWARLREAQFQALSVPETGMAVIIDIGQSNSIHPLDKADVGRRLYLAAEHVAYGKNDIVYSGPIYASMKIEGSKAIISFKQTGGGLTIGAAPSTQEGVAPEKAASALRGFAIAGDDHKFVWADAVIEGEQVIVSSPEVAHPVAVRYDWANNPDGNLYNKADDGQLLPASPFRTDDWPIENAPRPAAHARPAAAMRTDVNSSAHAPSTKPASTGP